MSVSKNLEDKINSLFNGLPEDVKKPIPSSGATIANYASALDIAHDYNQRLAVIHKYLLDAYGTTNKIADFDGCIKNLSKIFDELGLKEGDNPFITFMELDEGKYLKLITPKNLIILNNLYADGSITSLDLQGRSEDRTNHVIFQDNFYNVEDPEFTVDAYKWLSDINKLRQINYGEVSGLKDKKLSKEDIIIQVSEMVSKEDASSPSGYVTDDDLVKLNIKDNLDVKLYRGAFINGGEKGVVDLNSFRPTDELKQLLDVAATSSSRKERNKTSRPSSSEEIRDYFNNLTEREKVNLLKDIVNYYDIDVRDLK